ncbi:ovomucoid-like [Haliotis rufescens]|uniref:ovomucoid-like n=1 Tax=Haliotis rufescens TaxID=6454 RepID=UPI00201E80A0|nr:ovomucoid-like [Haliotis rufescens]
MGAVVSCCSLLFGIGCNSNCLFFGYHPKCGSDGNTYRNECFLKETVCKGRYVHEAYDGACHNGGQHTKSTEHPDHSRVPLTQQPPSLTSILTTSDPSVTPSSAKVTLTPTSVYTTEAVANNEQILEFFCILLSREDCVPELDEICATDGYTYRNYCEFQKSKCMHKQLKVNNFGRC